MIPVTKTFLPPQEEFNKIVARAWEKNWITNEGDLLVEFEAQLKSFLKVPEITVTTNGTLPLQIAIKALGIRGDVITSPFSYVATTSALVWEGCTPVFVDIDSKHLTIDESKIEAAITPKTTAILATHVFGNPCNVDVIETIANKHGLKVIYDAAHCFGVNYMGKSIFEYGDVSTCSFHATKIFHTAEGGAMFSKDKALQLSMYYLHNFGHSGLLDFKGYGINAKASEFQAAMGLAVLPYFNSLREARKIIVNGYKTWLNSGALELIQIRDDTDWNYHYFPIIFSSEAALLKVESKLNENGIFPRRYFFPSLNTLKYMKYKKMPISESIASRILCLPLYHDLDLADVERICILIVANL